MVLNGDPDAAKAQSLIKLGNTDIRNVSEFKYQLRILKEWLRITFPLPLVNSLFEKRPTRSWDSL